MTHQQYMAREAARPTQRLCDCGRPAVHRFNGPECQRCWTLRQQKDLAELRDVQRRSAGQPAVHAES